MPLQSHFKQYCLTDNYKYCEHFKKFSPRYAALQQQSASYDFGRRAYPRKKGRFPVLLAESEEVGEAFAEQDGTVTAFTVDYGQGGLRVRSPRPVGGTGYLFFSFDQDFIVPSLRGLAQVCWEKSRPGAGEWEAGLRFKDHTVQAMLALQMAP